ncbi:HupE/UreJ family protein [Pelomonas aquatica]|uniref:HupE/UreJ family protein n=1 Tax=Pelomonas aquatica TaxID=431058 RepID=A0A9X4LF55_9BURK|nr:HupE/UreJ family protein [Pelomonas aquatica]MCY4754041.1 HupE/UreJ family protein [Pelomonas aquatica]MDG0862340.1 HupE/UreJ family protein [Pelomonas aquatica]
MIRWLLLLLFCTAAQAHQSSEAYLSYRVDGAEVEQRLDIALRDLDRDLALDADGDGQLSWGEVRARWPDIERLAAEGLRFTADGAACRALDRAPPQLDEHSDGTHAVLVGHWRCAAAVHELQIDYRLFAATDAGHRGLARLVGAAGEPLLLVPGAGPQRLGTESRGFAGFVAEGMAHIASGLDHVLFLVTLLLVAVWRRDGAGWAPRAGARGAFAETLRLVTAFTVAHSITLGLAAGGVIAPPSRWVESLIALTVLLAALDNLRPFVPGPRWSMVAVFGLVHGVGFAGPLKDLGLRGHELVLPLLGFNLGVELGQLAVVALLLPLALLLRARAAYRRWIVPGGSSAIAALATLWLAERSLALNLLP